MVATATLLGSLGWDATAQASTVDHGTLSGSITTHLVSSAQVADVVAPSWCKPKFDHYNRTQLCWGEESTLYIYDSEGALIGTLQLYMFQAIHLHAIGRDFTENLKIFRVVPSGTIPAGLVMYLSGYCGSPCSTTIHFLQGSPPAVGLAGTIDHSDAIAAGKMHSTPTHYQIDWTAPGYVEIKPATWKSPLSYRCDDMLTGQGAGCVFPKFTPALTTMTKLPAIADNIRRIQNNGPGHYGRPGSGHPLHRLTNETQQEKNYRAVCGRRVVGPPPKGKSCDEYPFRSTYEGGTALSKANRGWAWVPAGEQSRQGGYIKGFYYANRVLDHDAFYVKV